MRDQITPEEMKERIRLAPDIELPGHELETLLYWFRPGWYGDMQVWTALDQESEISSSPTPFDNQ